MEITQLEFFLKVIEERSFSKAAERVFRTEPAVSLAIRRLEEEVGASLFDRSEKTPTLTDVGQVVYEYAQRIVALRDQARGAVAQLRALERGRVRVGANESTSLYLLPDVILQFRERHPQVRVEIFRHPSERLPREIIDHNVDFALMAYEPQDSDLEGFPVLDDELVLITHPEHTLARRDSVGVEELGSESFLAHNVRAASRMKVIETFMREAARTLCARKDSEPSSSTPTESRRASVCSGCVMRISSSSSTGKPSRSLSRGSYAMSAKSTLWSTISRGRRSDGCRKISTRTFGCCSLKRSMT